VDGLLQSGRVQSEPSETPRWTITPCPVSIACCRVAYGPQITVSPLVLTWSVAYFKQTLYRCGELWPSIGLGSFGSRLHLNYNAISDTAKISPCVPSPCVQNAIFSFLVIHIIPRRQIFVAVDNPSLIPSVFCLKTSSYLWNSVGAPDDVSHAQNMQRNSCQCFLTCTNFQMGSKWPKFSGIVVPARAMQYSTKAPSSFRSLMLNSHCSCHGRLPFSTPWHLIRHCVTQTQSFHGSPWHQLWIPVHRHVWNMSSPSKLSTWT